MLIQLARWARNKNLIVFCVSIFVLILCLSGCITLSDSSIMNVDTSDMRMDIPEMHMFEEHFNIHKHCNEHSCFNIKQLYRYPHDDEHHDVFHDAEHHDG